jgi:hypothetical protein
MKLTAKENDETMRAVAEWWDRELAPAKSWVTVNVPGKGTYLVKLDHLPAGDYHMVCTALRHQGANSIFPCAWCLGRRDVGKHKECSKCHRFSCQHNVFSGIDPKIRPLLHLENEEQLAPQPAEMRLAVESARDTLAPRVQRTTMEERAEAVAATAGCLPDTLPARPRGGAPLPSAIPDTDTAVIASLPALATARPRSSRSAAVNRVWGGALAPDADAASVPAMHANAAAPAKKRQRTVAPVATASLPVTGQAHAATEELAAAQTGQAPAAAPPAAALLPAAPPAAGPRRSPLDVKQDVLVHPKVSHARVPDAVKPCRLQACVLCVPNTACSNGFPGPVAGV